MKYPKEIKMSKYLKFSILTAVLVLFIGLGSATLEAAPTALSVVETSLNTIDIQTQSGPETIIPNASFSMKSLGRGLLGMLFLIGISFVFSSNKRAINWKMVGIGLSIQIILAIGILKIPLIQKGFSFVGQIFVNILDYTLVGSKFLLGNLLDLN
ncbi:MAG: Na+ dependent nucleoside transporter, partial [Flavobacteriaceae bacterium]|nr:Na+ dependent nucleoside transporter [Flavobacteriaceae bacterium]